MNHEHDLDALLDDVLSRWSVDDPPEDFATRITVPRQEGTMQTPTPPPVSDRLRPWTIPALMALAAAALVWMWLMPQPRATTPEPVPVTEPLSSEAVEPAGAPPVDLAQLEAQWRVLSRDIRAANRLYPFADGEDLPFSEFERLYGPGGEVDQFGKQLVRLLATGDEVGLHPVVLQVLGRTQRLRASMYRTGSAAFAFDVQLAAGAQVTEVSVEVDGAAVRYRNGPRVWERLEFTRPGTRTEASLNVLGLDSRTDIETSGPWAFFRLLDQASDRGAPGEVEGPFVFDFSDEGFSPVMLRLDGDPRDEQAAEFRRLLTHPMPAPRELWSDRGKCFQGMYFVAVDDRPGFCVDEAPVSAEDYRECADLGACPQTEAPGTEHFEQYCASSAKSLIDEERREELLRQSLVARDHAFRCVAPPLND